MTANGVAMRRHMTVHNKAGEGVPVDIADTAAAQEPVSQLTSEQPPTSPFESPPVEPRKSWRDKLGLGAKPKVSDGKERRPSTPRPRRVDPSEMLGAGWTWVGRKVEEFYSVPTGRALQIEAEPAGLILADALKDTALDRPVQWAARHYTAGSEVFALARLPVAVEMGARQLMAGQQLSPIVQREIIESLVSLAPYLVKVVKREAKKERDLTEAMEGLRDVFGIPDGQPITMQHIFGFLFPMPDQPIDANVSQVA